MPDQPLPSPEAAEQPAPPVRSRLVAALPFIATAVAAVLLSLLAQWLLFAPAPVAPTAAPPAAVVPTAPPTVPPLPAGSPIPAESVLRLALLDLEAQNRSLRSALYLLRAAAQLDDALVALQINQIDEADRALLLVYRSLDQAYAFSAEQNKGPLDTFRLQLSQIRDDLRLRPEGSDRRLRQLRSLILSLVEEAG